MVKINPMQPEPVKEIRDMETGIVIEKVYNPSVGRYDVVVTTGPSYMTKRQEAMDAMTQLLQANPNLWSVAGDLFIKNMDWPGAQEMAERFAKTIDPKLLESTDKDPALQAAEQQIGALQAELDNVFGMLQNVNKSIEAQDMERKEFEATIKAYDAETKRMQATMAGMTPEQIQDIVMGTLSSMLTSGDLVAAMPEDREMAPMGEMPMAAPPEAMPMEQPPMMPPGAPQ
jgi:hypothetical protein